MPRDPMESAEQAEAEADERFYEEREDRHPDEDDGQSYGHPADEIEERRQAAEADMRRFDELFDWFIEGPKSK